MAHAPRTSRMGADRQTDLFVEDVQCNSVLWFPEQKRGRDGEFLDDGICPRIVGVVDIPVPYPLLRAILRAFPGSELVAAVWDDVMPPPIQEDEWMYSSKNTYCPLFEGERQCKRDAMLPKTNIIRDELKIFWEFALEIRNWDPEDRPDILSYFLERPKPNLANIVLDTDLTNQARTRYDVAAWRLHMARHYAKLFGAYAMEFQRLDMRLATHSERIAKAIFDDVVAKRIHNRPRSYGWYVIKRYWLPIWTLRNWLWKTSVARKYAPGAPGYLEDLQNCDEFVDDGLTIDIDYDAFDQVEYDPIDHEFETILGKRDCVKTSEESSDSDYSELYAVTARKRMRRHSPRQIGCVGGVL